MSGRLPSLKAREVIRALEHAGFFVFKVTGSHYGLRHNEKVHLRVTVPYHTGDLKRGLLLGIIKQAGLTPEEFLKLL